VNKDQKKYVDESYKYYPVSIMAAEMGLDYIEVKAYCEKKEYISPRNKYKKPPEEVKSSIFNVDNYKTLTI